MKDLLQSFELWHGGLAHVIPTKVVGTCWNRWNPQIRAFRVDGKEMTTRCVLARWQHMRISRDPFARQIVNELGTSQRHLLVRIGGNSTRARNRFAVTDFDIDEASSIRSPAFYLHAPTWIRSFVPSAISPFGHNSKAGWDMETCKHRHIAQVIEIQLSDLAQGIS